jgi:hypothetical protein
VGIVVILSILKCYSLVVEKIKKGKGKGNRARSGLDLLDVAVDKSRFNI